MSNYAEKLKDPLWQEKRHVILLRDNNRCVMCGDGDRELHIHHWKYKGDPWEVPDEWLSTVCKYCHEEIEEQKELFSLHSKDSISIYHDTREYGNKRLTVVQIGESILLKLYNYKGDLADSYWIRVETSISLIHLLTKGILAHQTINRYGEEIY